jgi:hypothetical protein
VIEDQLKYVVVFHVLDEDVLLIVNMLTKINREKKMDEKIYLIFLLL